MNSKYFRTGIVTLLVAVGALALFFTWLLHAPTQASRGYSQFLTDVQLNKVTKVVQAGQSLTVTESGVTYEVVVPTVLTDVLGDMEAAATKTGGVAHIGNGRVSHFKWRV